jgi:uncharacterized membrane protein
VTFAHPVAPWLFVCLLIAAIGLAALPYMRARRAVTAGRLSALIALRALTLIALIVFLLRPVAPADRQEPEGTVAIVIDSSRSMALGDGGTGTRLGRAVALTRDRLIPALAGSFHVEVYRAREELERVPLEALSADRIVAGGAETDLQRTLESVRERFRSGGLAGVVLLSDGAETVHRDSAPHAPEDETRVITIGIGSSVVFDREIRSVATAPSVLDGSLVDLAVTTVLRGDRSPVRLRLLQNGRVLELRDVAPGGGSPAQQVFTVAPDRAAPTIFRIELEDDARELTLVNNRMDVLVPPPGRRRRVLMLEGAPGFEHTFLKRAWQQDTSLEVDAVVRKGPDDAGADTYYVQAAGERSAALAEGFPKSKRALFAYDTVVLANRELETFTREQLEWLAEFVGERGGGLLAFGGRTLSGSGADGSPIERVIPLGLSDRQGGLARASESSDPERFRVMPTAEGMRHPLMRLSSRDEDRRGRWAALPPLAGTALVGAPRPGASVLAITGSATGATVPLVTVQRFGRGRAMVFAGEASWRWKMLMPARDRSFETFWRQAARWLAVQAPDPVSVAAPNAVPVGAAVAVQATVRDPEFRTVREPDAELAVRHPDGRNVVLPLSAVEGRDGHYTATVVPSQPGVYRLHVAARAHSGELGTADQLILAGGVDPEFIDPGLNEPVLRRIAVASGGRYVEAADVARVATWLRETLPPPHREMQDLWHNAWSFLFVITLLSAEWTLRRRWGLR